LSLLRWLCQLAKPAKQTKFRMPELPEVQTIVNDLNKKILGRRIAAFWSDTPRIFKYTSIPKIKKGIKGYKIKSIARRAKNILITLQNRDEKLLLIHPKLTGHLLLAVNDLRKNKKNYIRAAFYLDNGLILNFSDLRKFGKIIFGGKKKIESLPDLKNLGPEPLDANFKAGKFINLINSRKTSIKQTLLNQEVVSGIGNIYSDETLWLAKINPFTPANRLTNKQLKTLFLKIKKVLRKAIKLRGSSVRNYRDTTGGRGGYAQIKKVYGRENQACYRCKTKIKRIKMGVRSAHFCPRCQKE